MKTKMKQILLLLAIIVLSEWIWFGLNFTLTESRIDYLERIPMAIPYIAILLWFIALYIKGSKKRIIIVACILILTPGLFYFGVASSYAISNCANYVINTCGATKIAEPIPMSQWKKSGRYKIACDDFAPYNDTNNVYIYHEYTSPWEDNKYARFGGYIFPSSTVNYTDHVIGGSGTLYDREPFVMRKGCRYTIEEIKQEDIGKFAESRWNTISKVRNSDGRVSGIIFNDTNKKVCAAHYDLYEKYKKTQIEIEPYAFAFVYDGYLTLDKGTVLTNGWFF